MQGRSALTPFSINEIRLGGVGVREKFYIFAENSGYLDKFSYKIQLQNSVTKYNVYGRCIARIVGGIVRRDLFVL